MEIKIPSIKPQIRMNSERNGEKYQKSKSKVNYERLKFNYAKIYSNKHLKSEIINFFKKPFQNPHVYSLLI